MEFLKRQLFFILCGIAAAAGVGLGVWGLQSSKKIEQELNSAKSVYNQLNSLGSNPVNKLHIDAEQERINLVVEDRNAIVDKAIEINRWEPLVPGYFPTCSSDLEEQFQLAYREGISELLDSLNWGSPADRDDIEIMKDEIAKEQRDREFGDAGASLPEFVGPPYSQGMVLTKAGASIDPVARAHMQKAQTIWCYAIDPYVEEEMGKRPPSLQVEREVVNTIGTSKIPSRPVMWRAQVTYWIQADVIRAIKEVNEQAAEEFRTRQKSVAEGERRSPWVGIMPVKDIVSIRVSDYALLDLVPPTGYQPDDAKKMTEASETPGTNFGTFTNLAGDTDYDVIQFSVKLVMDQRDIPRLIEAISKDRFHTLYRMAYSSLPPNRIMQGRIYGEEPVVLVVMDFETIMLADIYRNPDNPLMPAEAAVETGYEYLEIDGE